MTRSRLRPGYSVSSRSRVVSSVTRSGYGNPLIPRSRASSEYYSPISKASSGYYDSAAFDYAMDDTLSRSNYISSAAIDDFYDTSARSRGKDRRLLDETTTAIPLSASPPVYLGQTRTSQSLPNRRFLDSPRSSFIPRSIVRPYTSVVADTPAPRPRLSTIDLEASAPPRPSSLTLGSTWRQLNAAVKRPAYEAETEDLDDYLDDLGKPVSTSTDCAAASTSSSLSLRPRRLPKPPPPFVPSPYTSARAREALASAPDVRPFPNYFPPSASPSSSLSVTTLPSVREFLNSDSRVHPPGAASSLFPEDPMASRVRPPFHLAPLPARLSPSPPESDDEYGEGATATARRRRHHRVLGSKKRTGNYYERLKRRRAGREGSSRYWPYYDVESIGSSDVNGVLSDLDSLDGYDITGDYYLPDDDEDTEDYALATGGATGGEIDLDAEYVPFAPRRRYRLESPGILDLSPLASRAGSPERLTLPVPLSYRPTEASSLLTKSSAANDLMLGSMASSLATRAKSSFRDVDFSGYDHASLLVGVEGDLAVKHSGDKYGFKFYTPPISLKGAGLGSRYLGALTSLPEVTSYPRASSSSLLSSASSRPPTHDFFLDYLTRLQGLRSDVRSRLESEGSGEGKSRKRYPYASETPYTKHPSSLSAVALPSPSSYDHSTSYVPIKIDKTETVLPVTTYRKRLGGGLTHRLDVIPLPETERALPASNLLSLPRSQKLSPLSRDSREGPVEVSVLDKIKIKVSSETHASPRAAVASLRARSRVPVAGSTGPARSSYQVKSTTLSSSSYPTVPQVAAGARQQQLASSAPTVIRARVRGIPGMVILPKARALLSARRAADLASYYRAVSPFKFFDALDDHPPSADDERVVAASYREAVTMLARPRRAPVARITPSPTPILADYAKAHVMADRAIGSSRLRVRVADISYRRLGLAPRYRKHAVHYYYPGRSLVVPKRAHQYFYAAAPAAFVKSIRPRPPSRKVPGKASRLQVTPKSMYARVVRAVLFGEPMPGAEDTLPDLPFISRMYRLPLPPGIRTRLIASLTPRRGYVPLPYFPFYPRHPHVYRPLFPLLYRSALPLSFPPRVIPSSTALALLLHLRDMQEPPLPPPRRSRKGKTSSARVRPKSRSKSKKAAIVASKLEMEEPRRRRPRSKFAADKLRSVRLESLETQGRANYPASQPQNTYGLRASKPPLPKPSDRKSIRDVDGFTKPKNMLSWQYRLESRVDPADIYHPGAFSRMRHQILDAQDKMDRHRQMLDRYLPAESGSGDSVEGSILRKMEELEKRDPLGIGKVGGSVDPSSPVQVSLPSSHSSRRPARELGGPAAPLAKGDKMPMSETRRRLRRVIVRHRNDPHYYRE